MRELQKRADEDALVGQHEGLRQRRGPELSLSFAIQLIQWYTRPRFRPVVRGVIQHGSLAVRIRLGDGDVVERHVLGHRFPDEQQIRLDSLRQL